MSDFKQILYEKEKFHIPDRRGVLCDRGKHVYESDGLTRGGQHGTPAECRQKGNDRQIVKYLDKIIRIANSYRVDAREHYKLQDRLFQFLDQLETGDEAAFKALQHQVFCFDELCGKYQREQ